MWCEARIACIAGRGAALALLFAFWSPAVAAAVRDPPIQFDIAAQPLAPALQALAREAGIEILFDRSLLRARQAAELHGKMTVAQALTRMLMGSGMIARHTPGGAYVIVRVVGGDEPAPAPEGMVPIAYRTRPLLSDPPPVAEVLVIGRRSLDADIPRRIDDIQPYQVSTQADITASQALSVEDFFRSRLSSDAQSIAMIQAPALNSASTQSRIDLHGLGAAQTLVLVDGHRMPSAPTVDDFLQPDLNGIPLAAIDRIETLTSTAGGIYGPGATGGVVNIVLRRNIDGPELMAMTGATEKGDGLHWRLDGLTGGSFFDGRTRVTLVLSDDEDDGLTQGSRGFTGLARLKQLQLYGGPGFDAPVSSSFFITSSAGSRLRFSAANGGATLSSAQASIPFEIVGAPAVLAALKTGAVDTPDVSLSPDGQGALASLVTRTRTRSAVFSVRQEITPDLEVFIDSLYLDSLGTAAGAALYTQEVPVGRGKLGNPFTQSLMVSFPTPGLTADTTNHEVTSRSTFGVIRRLGHGWTSEVDLTLGRSTVGISTPQVVDLSQHPDLLDQPGANLFAGGPAISAQLSNIVLPANQVTKAIDNLTDLNLRLAGPVAHLPGGPLMVTLLGELRRETNPGQTVLPIAPDPTRTGSQKETVASLYGEARAPLISRNDGGLLSGLELQLALRSDAYGVTVPGQDGNVPTIGLTPVSAHHQTFALTTGFRAFPFSGVEVRGSLATGYLPPPPTQIVPAHFVFPQEQGGGMPPDPRRGGRPITTEGPILTVFNGSPTLEPEKAVSLSAGVVLTPTWLRGLRLSIDYTRIDKSHEIREPNPGDELTWLLAHEAVYPNRVTRAPLTAADMAKGFTGGIVTGLDFSPINMGRSTIDTVDINLDYRRSTPLGAIELYGQATWTPRFERRDDPFETAFNTVGHIDGPLQWRGDLGARLTRGPWTAELNAQLLSGYRVSYAATDDLSMMESVANLTLQGGDKVAWQGYVDGLATFAPPGARLQIRLGVRNLFDKRPPLVFIPQTPGTLGEDVLPGIGYSPYGDPRGRRFELSVSKRF